MAVPFQLKAFVSMIFDGPDGSDESKGRLSQTQSDSYHFPAACFQQQEVIKVNPVFVTLDRQRNTPFSVPQVKIHPETRKKKTGKHASQSWSWNFL